MVTAGLRWAPEEALKIHTARGSATAPAARGSLNGDMSLADGRLNFGIYGASAPATETWYAHPAATKGRSANAPAFLPPPPLPPPACPWLPGGGVGSDGPVSDDSLMS